MGEFPPSIRQLTKENHRRDSSQFEILILELQENYKSLFLKTKLSFAASVSASKWNREEIFCRLRDFGR